MKKVKLLILSLLLLIPASVFATENPKVLTLNAENDGLTINYEGTTESGAHAVMCKLYDSTNKELEMLSSAVDNNGFSDSFTAPSYGEYTVACANYEGGEIKKATVSVEEPIVTYTVSFNTNGGSTINDVKVNSGETVNKPTNPEKEGYTFAGWYEDETITTSFDFKTKITNNLTLYAKWDRIKYTVSFNTNGGSTINDVKVNSGETVNKPANPEKEGYTFENWYEDEEFKTVFNFNNKINDNITVYAKWLENEVVEEYTVDDGAGNSITFIEEEGHEYELAFIDVLPLTDEELAELEVTREEFNEVKGAIVGATNKYGSLLAVYAIEIVDEDDNTKDEGEFNIKIKLTDEMKKYNTFKLIYIKDDFTIENPITLTVKGDYLVGKLPHLSVYALVGSTATSTNGNPNTFDNIYVWICIFAISILGLVFGTIMALKVKKSNVK